MVVPVRVEVGAVILTVSMADAKSDPDPVVLAALAPVSVRVSTVYAACHASLPRRYGIHRRPQDYSAACSTSTY